MQPEQLNKVRNKLCLNHSSVWNGASKHFLECHATALTGRAQLSVSAGSEEAAQDLGLMRRTCNSHFQHPCLPLEDRLGHAACHGAPRKLQLYASAASPCCCSLCCLMLSCQQQTRTWPPPSESVLWCNHQCTTCIRRHHTDDVQLQGKTGSVNQSGASSSNSRYVTCNGCLVYCVKTQG